MILLLIFPLSLIIYGYSLPDKENDSINFKVGSNDARFRNDFTINYSEIYLLIQKEKEIIEILSKMETYTNGGYEYFVGTRYSVHRWIMEKYILKGEMKNGQVIHHINGDKSDNRIMNLQLFNSQDEHDRHHRNLKKNFGTWYLRLPEFANYQKFIECAF